MNKSDISSTFPRQKLTEKQKYKNSKAWFKECVDAAEDLMTQNDSSDYEKMRVWEDLDNDIVDQEVMQKVFNPMGLQNSTFPATLRNYPISIPKIDLLQGEELKRRFDYTVRAKNLDTETSEQTQISDMMFQILIEEATNKAYSEEDAQKRIKDFGKYVKYDWKSKHELTATRILQYLYRKQDLKEKFNRSFRNGLVLGKIIYRIDIEGGEPVMELVDPKTFKIIRGGNNHKIEDSDIVVEETYEPLNRVIDSFYDELSESDIAKIEDLHNDKISSSGGVLNYENKLPKIFSNVDFGDDSKILPITNYSGEDSAFDEDGNVRVVRVRWVGRKRVGLLKSIDENGVEKETIVSEYYKPREELGESISFIWINEAYEGTKIANEIYAKLQRRDVQARHFDNKSKCFLGYVGIDFGKSLMGRMEPYQYLYNIYMGRLEMIMAKYRGPIYELDTSKIPDDWDLDMWMYYADILGWSVIDSFNEGKKGAAIGKLAGNWNTSGRVLDPNIGNIIQQIIMMLQHIEEIMDKIAGVNDQRLGQISNRETVGGVERAVTQSSHITEKWFFLHDETKKKAMQALLDVAKFAWRNSTSKKLNFVLDDMSRVFLEFNAEDIASTEFDLFVTDSSNDIEIRQSLKQLAHAAVQNGASMNLLVDVLRSQSISDIASKIEYAEEQAQQRQMEMQQANNQHMQQMAQFEAEQKQMDRDIEYAKIEKDLRIAELESETKLTETQMKLSEDNGDSDKLANDMKKHNDKVQLDKEKLSETRRSNMAKEGIARSKPNTVKK